MKQKGLTIRLNEELLNEFNELVEENSQTKSALIRKWIENYVSENKKEETKMKSIKKLSWQEFMGLDEVQIDESPTGHGNALFYNDGDIQVSVDFNSKMINEDDEVVAEGHDDQSVWEDEELAKELKNLVIEEMEEREMLTFANYLRKVENTKEEHVDDRIKYFEPLGAFERYTKHCRENGLDRQGVEDIIGLETW